MIEDPFALGSDFDQLAAVLEEKLERHIGLVALLGQALQTHERRGRAHDPVDAEVFGKVDLHSVGQLRDFTEQTVLVTPGRFDGTSAGEVIHPGEMLGRLQPRHRVAKYHYAASGHQIDLAHLHPFVTPNEVA